MPSQICGFKDGEVKWFDGSRLPDGWSHEDPALKKESLPGDVQPGDGDGTLKGYDPDVDPDGEGFDADKEAQDIADKEAKEAADAQELADKEAQEAADAQAVADKEKQEAADAQAVANRKKAGGPAKKKK